MPAILRLAAMAACLSWCPVLAQGPGGPSLTDLSESGYSMRLEIAARRPLVIAVTVLGSPGRDALDFEVRGAPVGQPLVVRVENPFPGLAPQACEGSFAWRSAVRLAGGDSTAPSFVVVPQRARLIFRLAPPPGEDAPFYTYARFSSYIEQIKQEPLAQVTQLGESVQGRPLYRIVIDPPSPYDKRTVLMAVRQHGDEDGSSWVLEGALDLLLSRSEPAPAALLRDIRWVIYPLCNPDGAAANQRYNANGFDLNREWQRSGCSQSQAQETRLLQCDLEALAARWPIRIGADHHGWGGRGVHGGFRYALGQGTSFVSGPEYREARKDTEVIALHDPTQVAWQENGGTPGMLRAEMFLRYGFLLHTCEYDDALSSPAQFRHKGRAWVRAMYDTVFAPRFTDASGTGLWSVLLPGQVWITVDDFDENQLAGSREAVRVTVRDVRTLDRESFELLEVGPDRGVFRNVRPITVVGRVAKPGNGVLESLHQSTLVVRYVDPDYARDVSTGRMQVGRDRER